MKKIIQGFAYAILLFAIIIEIITILVVYTHIVNEKESTETPIEVINVVTIPEEKWWVVVDKLPVYSSADITSNIQSAPMTELKRGTGVKLLEEGDCYSKIQTENGLEGYVWFDCVREMTEQEFMMLRKAVIVVDAGHQRVQNAEEEPIGPGETDTKPKVSSGTQGVATLQPEHELNLSISTKIEELLEEQGYTVVMIRKTADVNISNMERAVIANQIEADAFVRIHANGSENPDATGAMTIISTNENKYDVVNYYNESKKLATYILDMYTAVTGIDKNRVMESDSYSGINWCTVPVTIVEMGFMTNVEEDNKMQDSAMQEKMAYGIAEGIKKYLINSGAEG